MRRGAGRQIFEQLENHVARKRRIGGGTVAGVIDMDSHAAIALVQHGNNVGVVRRHAVGERVHVGIEAVQRNLQWRGQV